MAKDFGISESCRRNSLHAADVEADARPGEATELKQLRGRNGLLEQENEILRRAAADLAHESLTRDVPDGP